MRLSISLLASLGVVGSAVAQTNNEFFLYSGTTNFTTRSALAGSSEGEICQRYPAAFFNGIGQYAVAGSPVNRIAGMRYVLQDQSGVTQEFYEVGAKGDDPLAPGFVDPTNDLFRLGPFGMPASTATGAVAWIFTVTLATPFDTAPAQGDIYAFCDVPANPAWTADGVSVHMSGWTNAPVADQPNLNATIINFVNVVDQTAILNGTSPQGAVSVNNTRFQRLWFTTPAATLKIGADVDPAARYAAAAPNPNYGCAGLYPDQNAGRNDGMAFRFVDGNLPNTLVGVLGNFGGFSATPLPTSGFIPGSVGSIYLNIPWLNDVFAFGTTDGTGTLESITFPWPFTLSAPVGVMTFQAVALDLANSRIVASNAAAIDAQ